MQNNQKTLQQVRLIMKHRCCFKTFDSVGSSFRQHFEQFITRENENEKRREAI